MKKIKSFYLGIPGIDQLKSPVESKTIDMVCGDSTTYAIAALKYLNITPCLLQSQCSAQPSQSPTNDNDWLI
jgi:hypothetical protein